MMKNKHNTVAIIAILIFGVVLFYIGTDGFEAYTAETARTNELIEEKPEFPDVTLEDSEERVYPISEFENKYVMLTFIYTACTDVCLELEMNLTQVYDKVPSEYIGEDIIFLSISFDPTNDDPETLDKYRNYFNSDGETWRMARINNQNELDYLLDEFGVTVIPDGDGHFTHNSAFYLVDPTGTLVDVMDYTKIENAAEKVTSILDRERDG
ncbi:protein SCO1/2 [Virgibacillus natechei]|uniref:Protein SCO1/2 n=1 Tax=Virgibacillus natechei TaxID=1216297 RepID=A0ABS4IEX1_9BACI|nr:SCO family protein [Virgibacillus natechei]MBP1969011.1 protein SCO1/2 [Virgibacillus natechei]UZD14287.1 SCO family protein [Virgibacillus natechei]